MSEKIRSSVKALEAQRKQQNKIIDAELAKLRVLCEHKRTLSHPAPGMSETECLDCGKWW